MSKSLLITFTILLGLCCVSTFSQSIHRKEELLLFNIFKDWISNSNKFYGIDELLVRFSNWKNNYDYVLTMNAKDLGVKLEMNRFADMAPEEFNALYLGLNADLDELAKKGQVPSEEESTPSGLLQAPKLPKSVDWRDKNAVTPVLNQGKCGGCYSFAAAGALEGLYAIKKDSLVSLSVQQMIDCSSSYGNLGCNGGLMTFSYNYTQTNGIQAEKGYSYTAKEGECKHDPTKAVFKNAGWAEVAQNNSKALKAAVAKQPVSVGMEAASLTVQLYKSGVITRDCSADLDHAVLIVGYETDRKGQEYWIVKNSWGTEWGNRGYFNVAIGQQNKGAGVCGINMLASYPTL